MNDFLAALLQGPHSPQQDFTCHGATFADVYAMAGQLYTDFSRGDGREGSIAPVCLATEDRSVIAAALLAAMASSTVLALPHSFSKTALQQMQEATGFTTAVVDGERALPKNTHLLFSRAGKGDASLPQLSPKPDARLLQLFTGGSTGTPQIWSKTAANLFGEARFMAERYQISAKDTIVATVPPSHIYGLLFSVVIPLVVGANVLAETPSFPAEIEECVQRELGTLLVSVPAHYRVLNGRHLHPSLRLAFSSAGMLDLGDNEGFCRSNDAGIVEVYGSTETGGLATRNRSQGEDFFQPLEQVTWKVKEERLFVQSPFLSPDLVKDEDGFFLSGDRVQRQGDKSISLHGRADAVTKVGGERVDLDEVRDVLQKVSGVRECVVVALEDKTGRGNRIAALVRGDAADLNAIQKSIALFLEPAALPKRIRIVSEIPVTANGKYDRAAITALLSAS